MCPCSQPPKSNLPVSGSLTEATSGRWVLTLPLGKEDWYFSGYFSQASFICTENAPAHSPLFSSLDMILKNPLGCTVAVSNSKKISVAHLLMKKSRRKENPSREDADTHLSPNNIRERKLPSSPFRISSQTRGEAARRSPPRFSRSTGTSITPPGGVV